MSEVSEVARRAAAASARASWVLAGIALTLALAACGKDSTRASTRERAVGGPSLRGTVEVETEAGVVRGRGRGEVEVFRGIPYAAPPVGPLRFRPPAPVEPWTGVREALAPAPKCPQRGLGGVSLGQEDCLYLNLWRPRAPAGGSGEGSLRPVLVFIHGGANVLGSGAEPLQDPRELVAHGEAIVVSFNYRLGLLGFLAHPALTRESGTSGNWAYLDQIAALEWVAANIAAFGGDPERVAIFGHSAGALGACVLLASPKARGLFSAAILQSGGCDVAELSAREAQGRGFVAALGCGEAREAELPSCLRELPAEAWIERTPPFTGDITSWELPVGGAIDGVVLPESPWRAFAERTHNAVPTLVGSTADETEIFVARSLDSCAARDRLLRRNYGEAAEALAAAYPCARDEDARSSYVQLSTEGLFGCQARRILRALAPAEAPDGEAPDGGARAPVYRYLYAQVRGDPAVRELRAFHGGELQLLFGTMRRLGYTLPPGEAELSELMQASWVAMAREGSPVLAETPGWTAWDPGRDNALILAWPVETRAGLGAAHCGLWDELAAR